MELSTRMKRYEGVTKNFLMARTPAIIRIDGKAFHTWTKGLDQPFDEVFYACMANTAKELVNRIQCATIAYGQSDEISILLKDYATNETEQWFSGNVQKIASVSASIATAVFNSTAVKLGIDRGKLALFDARVFTLPQHEVTNYFIWRQKDFRRNSIQAVGQYYLGHKNMQGLNSQNVLDALTELDVPIDWYYDYDSPYRRGYSYQRGADSVNFNIPEFNQLRDFIEVHLQTDV